MLKGLSKKLFTEFTCKHSTALFQGIGYTPLAVIITEMALKPDKKALADTVRDCTLKMKFKNVIWKSFLDSLFLILKHKGYFGQCPIGYVEKRALT